MRQHVTLRKLHVLLAIVLWVALSVTAVAAEKKSDVRLEEENSSGIRGTAVLTDNGDNTTTIKIVLKADMKGAKHPAHLHEGTCTGSIPTVRYPLEDVVNGRSTTRVQASLATLLSEPLYINIHPSHKKLQPVITCGSLSAPNMPRTGDGGPSLSLGSIIFLSIFAAAFLSLGMLRTLRAWRS